MTIIIGKTREKFCYSRQCRIDRYWRIEGVGNQRMKSRCVIISQVSKKETIQIFFFFWQGLPLENRWKETKKFGCKSKLKIVAGKEALGGALNLVNFQSSRASRFMFSTEAEKCPRALWERWILVLLFNCFSSNTNKKACSHFVQKRTEANMIFFFFVSFTNRIYATLLMGVHHASISFRWLTNRENISIDFRICPFVNCTGLEGWLYSQTFLLLSVKILRWYHHQ